MPTRIARNYVSSIWPQVMLFAFPLLMLPSAATTIPMMVAKLLAEHRYFELVGCVLLFALMCSYWWLISYRTKRVALIEGNIVVSSPWAEETIPLQNVSDVRVKTSAHPRVAIHLTQTTRFGNPIYFVPKFSGYMIGSDNLYVEKLRRHIARESLPVVAA